MTTIKEDHGHDPTVDYGQVDITKSDVRSRVNSAISRSLAGTCITPYVGLERIRKALAYWHISIPGVTFLEGDSGSHTFEVSQFGNKIGWHEKSGEVVTNDEVKFHLEFSWHLLDAGGYKIRADIRDVQEKVS